MAPRHRCNGFKTVSDEIGQMKALPFGVCRVFLSVCERKRAAGVRGNGNTGTSAWQKQKAIARRPCLFSRRCRTGFVFVQQPLFTAVLIGLEPTGFLCCWPDGQLSVGISAPAKPVGHCGAACQKTAAVAVAGKSVNEAAGFIRTICCHANFSSGRKVKRVSTGRRGLASPSRQHHGQDQVAHRSGADAACPGLLAMQEYACSTYACRQTIPIEQQIERCDGPLCMRRALLWMTYLTLNAQ